MKRTISDSYSHILKYTGLFGGVQVLTIFANLIRNKAMAVLLGAEGLGLNSMLYSVQLFTSQCTNLGLPFGSIPVLSDSFERGDETQIQYSIQMIRLWSMIAAVLGLLFCLLASPLLGHLTFTWGHFMDHYAALSLSVSVIAITGGETAILKATRRLGLLARVQVYTAIASVVISLPLYFFLSYSGILPSIILMAAFAAVATIACSYHCYPLKLNFTRSMLRDGSGMVRLGLAFVLASAIGSGSEMLIRAFLNVDDGLNAVGLYNAGYMITITYAGLVFTAMESDYFPRLSAICQDIKASNDTVNRQIEVSLLLLSPMLMGLIMMLPVLIPLLFSAKFMLIVDMTQVAVLAMFFKVLTLPVAYITLARGYSLSYLMLETMYYIVFVLAVVVGFYNWGIYGTGVAIVAANVFDMLMIYGYAYWKYGFRSTRFVMRYGGIQTMLGITAYAVSCLTEGWLYWITEAALVIASTAYSLMILRQKTHLWESLKRRFRLSKSEE